MSTTGGSHLSQSQDLALTYVLLLLQKVHFQQGLKGQIKPSAPPPQIPQVVSLTKSTEADL